MNLARESGSFVPTDQVTADISPVQEHPENRREALLEELDRNLGLVLELQTIVDQEMFASTPDEARRRLGEFRDALWADEPAEVIQLWDEWKQLASRLQELNDSDKAQKKEDMTEEQYQQFVHNEEEGDKIVERLREIEHDDRLTYLLSLDQLTTSLEDKATQVSSYRQDRKLLLQEAKVSLGRESIDKLSFAGINFNRSVKQVFFDTFGVTLVADQGFIEFVHKGSHGFHQAHTPFSFAADRGEETKHTIEHERSHNIVDASVTNGRPGSSIVSRYKRIQRYKETGAPTVLIQTEQRTLLERLRQPGHITIDQLHDELLAEFPELRAELQKTPEMFLVPDPMKFPLSKSSTFRLFYEHASTAGWEAGQYVKTLEKIASDHSDPELAAAAVVASDDFGGVLSSMLKHVMETGELSQKYGLAAERDAQAALYILRPSKYRHIPNLLQYKYG